MVEGLGWCGVSGRALPVVCHHCRLFSPIPISSCPQMLIVHAPSSVTFCMVRHDWNSLLDTNTIPITNRTADRWPAADTLVEYLQDFAKEQEQVRRFSLYYFMMCSCLDNLPFNPTTVRHGHHLVDQPHAPHLMSSPPPTSPPTAHAPTPNRTKDKQDPLQYGSVDHHTAGRENNRVHFANQRGNLCRRPQQQRDAMRCGDCCHRIAEGPHSVQRARHRACDWVRGSPAYGRVVRRAVGSRPGDGQCRDGDSRRMFFISLLFSSCIASQLSTHSRSVSLAFWF